MADESSEFELADATRVRVMETNLLHASDVIYWLDGASANSPAAMSRIEIPLQVTFTEKPRVIRYLHSLGKTAFWQTPDQPMHAGVTTDAERERPAQAPFQVAGHVSDPRQLFNPAAFAITLGAGNGQGVVLYPSPLGVTASTGGVIQGRVLKAVDGEPLVWGLLTLEVSVGLNETITFTGQTDAKGDFRIALKRLPPLPLNTTDYNANLRISGDMAATKNLPANSNDFVALNVESATQAGNFSQQLTFKVRPGLQQRINSMDKLFIAVQTV
jgi:hypothetical protein